jgi:hypothetical protein
MGRQPQARSTLLCLPREDTEQRPASSKSASRRPRRVRESRLCGSGAHALLQSEECASSGVAGPFWASELASRGRPLSGRDVTPDVASGSTVPLLRECFGGPGMGGNSQTRHAQCESRRRVLCLRAQSRPLREGDFLSVEPTASVVPDAAQPPAVPPRRRGVRPVRCQASSYAVAHTPSGGCAAYTVWYRSSRARAPA